MKRLTLMRHADARWKDVGLSDLERPLSRRGTHAAQAMAQRLLSLKLLPDLVLVSPARRAQQTAEILARELSLPAARLLRDGGRYLAGAPELLKSVRGTGPRISHLMLIAHNPGLSELVELLSPEGADPTLGTAGVCSMTFECAAWTQVDAATLRQTQRESPPTGLFGRFS